MHNPATYTLKPEHRILNQIYCNLLLSLLFTDLEHPHRDATNPEIGGERERERGREGERERASKREKQRAREREQERARETERARESEIDREREREQERASAHPDRKGIESEGGGRGVLCGTITTPTPPETEDGTLVGCRRD